MDSLSSSAAEGMVEELPDAEVKAGKLCGFRDNSPDLGSSGVSGTNGRSRSSIDISVRLRSEEVRSRRYSGGTCGKGYDRRWNFSLPVFLDSIYASANI